MCKLDQISYNLISIDLQDFYCCCIGFLIPFLYWTLKIGFFVIIFCECFIILHFSNFIYLKMEFYYIKHCPCSYCTLLLIHLCAKFCSLCCIFCFNVACVCWPRFQCKYVCWWWCVLGWIFFFIWAGGELCNFLLLAYCSLWNYYFTRVPFVLEEDFCTH